MTRLENDKLAELTKIVNELCEIKKQNNDDIKEMKEALLGNAYNRVGMVQKVEDLQVWRLSVETSLNKTKTHWEVIKSYGAFICALVAIAYEVVSAFFKK